MHTERLSRDDSSSTEPSLTGAPCDHRYLQNVNPMDWHAAEWGAFGQVGALVVAAVAGLLVWLQVRHGRQVREDQTRPYVIVDFEFRGMLVLISVKNIGTTPAANVHIMFDKPLQSPTQSLKPERFAVFSEPIAMMAPGRAIRVYFGMGPDFFPTDGEGVPLRYEVEVRYSDLGGKRNYIDPSNILDLAPFKHTSVDRDDLHEIAQRVKGIEQAMKQWTQRGRLGINSITQAEIDERDAEYLEERHAEDQSADAGGPPKADDQPG
jgi:hypothetical protein